MKVLIVYYSQTGQLERVARAFAGPLDAHPQIELYYENLRPRRPYPFPWRLFEFLDVFPESVYLDPPELEPYGFDPEQRYDLVILAYTVWFLAPAPPITAFLQSPHAQRVLAETPVVTVVACRNMWVRAQESVKALLERAGGLLSDHVSFVDRGPALATFFTTPRWMLTGRKDPWLKVFPAAGVAEDEIEQRAPRLGRALRDALLAGEVDGRKPVLRGLGAAQVDERLIASEKIGQRSFRIWGRLVRAVGKPGAVARKPVLAVYLVFLVTMIATVVPLSLLLRRLFKPLLRARLAALKRYYEAPSGSGRERVEDFDR